MRIFSFIIMGVLICSLLKQQVRAECNTNTFIEAVNSAWVTTNYILLKEIITNRVAECTNDILAMGLVYEYYDDIDVDFFRARDAAVAFVSAVSNRMPSEVLHRRIPMDVPIMLAQMETPTNFPANQTKTAEQMQHLHYWYPKEFPHLGLFQMLVTRIESLESGRVTEEDVAPFNQ